MATCRNRWSGRAIKAKPQNTQPTIFTLAAGSHTLRVRGREANSKLDRLCLTSDPAYNPDQPEGGPLAGARIYYTLDGTDPRRPGGGVSPQARVYQSPLVIVQNVQLFARVLQDQRWSPPTVGKFSPGP